MITQHVLIDQICTRLSCSLLHHEVTAYGSTSHNTKYLGSISYASLLSIAHGAKPFLALTPTGHDRNLN